jgi:hypothetical protein
MACGGLQAPSGKSTGARPPISPDAPSWARNGDAKTDEGSLFVCEGGGPDEAQALDAARALCSAKICALCGVEVQATTETHETLQKVDVERKVVETCRRVRKSEDDVRYRQAGCGPQGCTAWLQVFFGSEAEARECRAYADGNYADSAQCETLIAQFRTTPGLTAESFRIRANLLAQAIVACAEIDVRPTPKLMALDEILWQGVVTPRAEPRLRRPIENTRPMAERLRLLTANETDAAKTMYAEQAYAGMERQPLLEDKVFVDRIAQIRDAMLGYATIMAAMEAVADTEQTPDAAHDAALVSALRGLTPVRGKMTPERVLAWAADEISRNRRTLTLPGLKAYLMEKYAASAEGVAGTLMRAFAIDGRAAEDEWRFVMGQMRGCVRCAATLLALPDHGDEQTRIARLVEVARSASTDADVETLQSVNPELLLHAERALDAALAARIFSYAWYRRWLEKLPTAGRESTVQTLRDTYSSGPYDWRWTVAPSLHVELAARAYRLLQPKVSSMRCDTLDKELALLESHGVDTHSLEDALCSCVSRPSSSGMRDMTELYQRLVTWGAACVGKVGT